MIHTYGDSHADFSFRNIESIIKHPVASITMKSAGKESNIKHIKKMFKDFGIKRKDNIILCFGEIDCRAHIHNEEDKNKAIEGLVENYFKTIIALRNKYINIIIMSVPPPAHNTIIITHEFPFRGSDNERSGYTKKMNELIESNCKKNDICFLNIYNDYKDEKGMLKTELSNDKLDCDVHIGDTSFIKKRLQTMGILSDKIEKSNKWYNRLFK